MGASSKKYLAGLNPRQREAVCQTKGPLLVLAGAGSGKTRVVTRRVAYILAEGLAAPEEILAVTFTNKAAAEMRERAGQLVGKARAGRIIVSTFHSFCLRVLRAHIEKLGYRRNFTIAREGDSRVFLRRAVDDLGGIESLSPGLFQSAISLYKNRDRVPDPERPGAVANSTEEKYQAYMAPVYVSYQSALRAANSLDFDDLLVLTLRLWNEHPKMLARFQKQFRYVMVDEYQDTNHVQYEIVRNLVAKHRNLCVVGDDDQSIYAWRGADVRHILDFERGFPEAKTITLDRNYRSTETILEAANSVIRNNTARRDKELWSKLGKGRPIDHFVVADEEAEAKQAIKWLKYIQDKSGARYRDFALLYRSNIQSKPFEIAFRQAGIPYVVVGGQDFFDRIEVRDIISYLKAIANPRDEAAFLRVVNMPRRGIGDTTLHRAHELCVAERLTLGKALAELMKRGLAPPAAEQGIRQFLALLSAFRRRFRERDGSLTEIAADLVDAIDYRGELDRIAKRPEQAFARWQNVELVLKAVDDYEKSAEDPTLIGFLDESHLNSDDKRSKDERRESAVTLMTIHSAKGLEFPFVFIVGVEDGLIPHENSIRDNALEEERRLFYVALTRGKRHVTLFEALRRAKHGNERPCTTSRFLDEIPEELLKKHVHAVREMAEAHADPPKAKRKKRRPKKRPRT